MDTTKWKKRKYKNEIFYPAGYVERIEEPDFGCEGRPEGESVYAKLLIQTKDGKKDINLEEKLLWESGLDDSMWLGSIPGAGNRIKHVLLCDGKEEILELNPTILELLEASGISFTYKKEETSFSKITEGVIWQQLLFFFFPMLLGTFFQQLYNTIDAVVVGRFVGKIALSAVGGTTGTLTNMLVGFFVGSSSGATVIISQYYGARKGEEVKKSVHTAIALAIVGGAVIMILGLAGSRYALIAMDTPDDILPFSLLFIRIYFCGMIPNLIYNMGAGILRAIGDSKRPLYFLVISCITNIILDFIFVLALNLGVAGVATATVLSQTLSAVLVMITLMRTTDSYQLELKKIRFHKEMLLRILKIGLPTGFQSLMYSSSNVIIQSNVNQFGTNTIAAWTAFGKIDGLFWMTINSFGVSVTTFVGQNFGAGKIERVKKGIKECFVMAMAVSIVISVLLYYLGGDLLALFSKDQEVIDIGIAIIHFIVPTYFTYVSIEILAGSLRGMGSSLIPMLLTCFGVCVFRIVWIFTAVPIWPTMHTVIMSYPLTWATTSVLFILYFYIYTKKSNILSKNTI